ncbi:hypothetical protein N7457_007824 [Penicillium paradoxum]|uniref:uncharacterized protein n=1 Tax=Penicillium paradoxum TaxID=176176 RepID=UPI002546B338|nr:uncharacterized protein N7457_007824 [Penicillium paradoxum]KAJ5772928.1 hypothetical protein N7457_007824 [Penicillium paradoxum]
MLAARFHGREDIRLDKVEEPKCGKGEVKMKPAFVGLCGSDLHEYTAGPVLIPETPHPITGSKYPVTMGHEFSGIVEEVGDDINYLSAGQRVVVRPTIFDRTCSSCKKGIEHCCENIGFIGLSGYGGGLAEHIVAPVEHFYPIPNNVSLESAALVEPLAVAWHAVNISPFKPGDNVLIVGGGPIGIGIVQVLKVQGAKSIMVVEPTENRKQLAQDLGATYLLDPQKVDVPEMVHQLTNDIGADVLFDTAGVEIALDGAISACRIHGTIVNIAVWEKKPAVDVNDLMYKELNYMGAALYDEASFKDVIKAISYGQLKPDEMVTSTIKLSEVVEKGFKALIEHRDQHCKILVDMQNS